MLINRRSFLVAAGAAATATVAACSTAGQPAAVATATTASPTTTAAVTARTASPVAGTVTTATPTGIDLPALAKALGGRLVTPNSAGYALARRSYNPLYDTRRPVAVALCRTTSDVQHCVTAAARAHQPVAARSGGHSYAGYSTPDGALVVDLAGLSGVKVSGATAVVGAGTRLVDVYAALAAAGRCLPAGSCPSVGVAGLTLGGGIGVLARKYGLTCDRLTAATVVTADGVARTVSAGARPDLFWALRGGGGGNFGVVTSFTFATVPAPALTVFQLGFPAGSVPHVFGVWQGWLRSAPDELWTNLNITGTVGRSTCTVSGCFVGSAATLKPLLDRLVRGTGAPRYRRVLPMGYLNAMRYFAGCSGESMAQCVAQTRGATWRRETFAASSRMLAEPVADPARLADVADGHPGLHVIVDGLGGAVGRVAPAATAFPHRSAVASVQVYLKTTVAGHAAAARQVTAVRNALTPVTGSGAYVNYIDATLPGWAAAYYGANLPRLRTTAQRYDPDRVFTFAQAVNRS